MITKPPVVLSGDGRCSFYRRATLGALSAAFEEQLAMVALQCYV